MKLGSVCTSAFPKPVKPITLQSAGIEKEMGPLGSSMVSNSGSNREGAHARNLGDMVRTETSSCNCVQSSSLPFSRDSSPAAWCSTAAHWKRPNSNYGSLHRHRASLVVAVVMDRIHRNISCLVRILSGVHSKKGCKSARADISARCLLWAVASSCSLSFKSKTSSGQSGCVRLPTLEGVRARFALQSIGIGSSLAFCSRYYQY